MRRNLTRPRIMAVATAVALLAGSVAWTQLGGAAGATGPDTITYNQQTGSNGTYIAYVPGDGSKSTKQSVTSGGGCATPTPSGVPLLGFSASYYPNGYAQASTPAIVGAYKSRTGVCQTPQAWSIENKEALVFSVGSNSLVAGRVFSRAKLLIEREDKSLATDPPAVVQLVLRVGSTVVDSSKTFNIAGPNGTQLLVDTGNVPTGFDSVEIRVVSPATGSVSVVGPTSTFYFASRICPGDTITTSSTDGTVESGQVSASITYPVEAANATCKSYTFFGASSTDPNSSDGKSIQFLSQQIAGAHVTTVFDWGYFPNCRPDGTAPTCPITEVDFGNGFQPQTFCAQASPTDTVHPWCTTSKHFDYIQDPLDPSVTLTHITETWDGYGDVYFRH
jgi:hypothetical protein